jgi:hypothetical protein
MAYKDPQKQKAAARESMRALRARRKLEQLKSPAAGARPAASGPSLSLDGLTQSAWAAKLVAVGVAFVEESERVLSASPKDAIALATAGAALVNSNCQWADERGEVEDKSPDMEFMADQTFRDHMEQALIRKIELQEQAKQEHAKQGQSTLEVVAAAPPGGVFHDDDEEPGQ